MANYVDLGRFNFLDFSDNHKVQLTYLAMESENCEDYTLNEADCERLFDISGYVF